MLKSELNPEEKELYDICIINDILDVFLFLLGLFIPFSGDLIESIIGGLFDLILFYWMFQDKDIRFNAIWILLLELFDLGDFATMGLVDIIGWIEVIPFWVIGFRLLKSREVQELKEDISKKAKKILKSVEKTPEIIKEMFCPHCNSIITPEMRICESCGIEINLKDKP